jgi:hypothetical protein
MGLISFVWPIPNHSGSGRAAFHFSPGASIGRSIFLLVSNQPNGLDKRARFGKSIDIRRHSLSRRSRSKVKNQIKHRR